MSAIIIISSDWVYCFVIISLQIYYLFGNMSLGKNQIVELQKLLSPATKKYNILQVIQRFPDNQHMHQTFRQICLHYQTSSLSFNQIMQYLFGQFNKINSQSMTRTNQNKASIMRVAKNQSQEEFKVALLPNGAGERIKQLVMIDDRYEGLRPIGAELYVVGNGFVREYNMGREGYGGDVLRVGVGAGAIDRVTVFGNILAYINVLNQFYVQILPHKLEQITKKQSKYKPRVQISQTLMHKLSRQQKITQLLSFNQQQHVVCTKQKLLLITIPLSSQHQHLSSRVSQLDLSLQQQQNFQITRMTILEYPYVGLLTNSESLIIVNAVKMKITNRIFNDVNFAALAFNGISGTVIVSDFGGYLMSMCFNKLFGDIEEQGMTYKKRKIQYVIPNPKPQQFQTQYIHKRTSSNKSPPRRQTSDVPTSKQQRTIFSKVVQNSNRYVLEILVTKEKSVFSYEGKFDNVIKIWNLGTLMVYQKVDLTLRINQMKVCGYGLYLVSSEKGYLCYYPLQKPSNPQPRQTQLQVLQLAIHSNILYLSTTDMSQNIVYKLRLSNKPIISQYLKKPSKNSQKDFKYTFYKNQVLLFNVMRNMEHQLEVYGVFGETKEVVGDVKEFGAVVAYPMKQGVVFWNSKRVRIRCKQINKYQQKTFNKGAYIIQTHSAQRDKVYNNTIILNQQINKVKIFKHYLTIICQGKNSKNTSCTTNYIIDQNTMNLVMYIPELSNKYRIIQSHKNYCIILKKEKVKGVEHREFFLYDYENGVRVWRSEGIQGWGLEGVYMLDIDANSVDMLSIYKSTTYQQHKRLDHSMNVNSKPLFYLIKAKIKLIRQSQKKFINLSQNQSPRSQVPSQTFMMQDIMNRSIFQKLTTEQLESSKFIDLQSNVISKNNYKIYFPYNQYQSRNKANRQGQGERGRQRLREDQRLGYGRSEIDLRGAQGEVLHYQRDDNIILFGVTVGTLAILYEMDDQVQAQLIGILNFDDHGDIENNMSNDCKKYIHYWSQKYKKYDELLWQQAKNRAINRIKHNFNSPILSRADSLRNTNRKFNPQILQQNIIIPTFQSSNLLNQKKKSKSYNKIPAKTDPVRINQLIYKSNIYQHIQKERDRDAEKDQIEVKLENVEKGRVKTQWVTQPEVKGLITTVRKARDTLFKDRTQKPQQLIFKQKTEVIRKLKTENSQKNILKEDLDTVKKKRSLKLDQKLEQKLQQIMKTKKKQKPDQKQSQSSIKSPLQDPQGQKPVKYPQNTLIRSKFEQLYQNSQSKALKQLQKSKIIEQSVLPQIATMRSQSLFKQQDKKIRMYEMIYRKRDQLRSSRRDGSSRAEASYQR